MSSKKYYAPFGSISSGTMKQDDVYEACIDCLADVAPRRASRIRREWNNVARECSERGKRETIQTHSEKDCLECDEARSEILNETLWNALNEFAPPYAYFGSHMGDGADFGFWLSEDSIDDAVHCHEAIKVGDLAEIPKGYSGDAFVVNDHGNMTLYHCNRGRKYRVWSLV